MKVRDFAKVQPSTCRAEDSLRLAGETMRGVGCGVLPVVGPGDGLVGILTDRDICCALTRLDRRPSDVSVAEAMTSSVRTCSLGDPIVQALETMQNGRVRRLPVLDTSRRVVGLLSLDDIAAAAHVESGKRDDVTWREIGATLHAISVHPVPQLLGRAS